MSDGIEPGEGGVAGISFTVTMLCGLDDSAPNVIEGRLVVDSDIDMLVPGGSTNDEDTVDPRLVMAAISAVPPL